MSMRVRFVAVLSGVLVAAMLLLPAMSFADETISLEKTASPSHLDAPGSVTYTYTVRNTSNPPQQIVMPVLVDDKLGTIAGPASGNTHASQYLDPDETWIYTKTVTISEDTTNTATVSGTFVDDQVVHTASASANVTVGTEEVTPPADNGGGTSGTETEVSGAIPKTATPYYNVLAIGSALLLIGAVGVAAAARARRT